MIALQYVIQTQHFAKKVQLFLLLRYSFNYHNFQYRSFNYGFRMVKSIKEKIFKLLI